MQQLWLAKIGWDAAFPDILLTNWRNIYSRLAHLNELKIARWTGFGADSECAELHDFADASRTLPPFI